MSQYKNSIIRGTFILMLAGLLTRVLGFYYRIFLSSRIGAEGMGLYQMIFPIYGLCMSLSVSGVQTAISHFVSGREKSGFKTLVAGLLIAVPLSLICSCIMFFGSDIIAACYLNEPRCSILLKFSAISVPMAVIHNCINGYFLGKKNATIPGTTQFIEQFARVAVVWIIFHLADDSCSGNIMALAVIAIVGLIAGEFMSMVVSLIAAFIDKPFIKNVKSTISDSSIGSIMKMIRPLAVMAWPLTLTSVLMSGLHSLEAMAIPFFLHKYGLTYSSAISLYGILTAMAMPFIFFPTTITSAVSRMLLPAISAAQAENKYELISKLSTKTLKYSVALGMFCTCFFILTGDSLGRIVYNNETVGDFITILAWLCPLMFISGTLGSILHGLGMTKTTFYQNMISSCLRLAFTVCTVPTYGIKGYLWGILASELLCAIMHTVSVMKYVSGNQLSG